MAKRRRFKHTQIGRLLLHRNRFDDEKLKHIKTKVRDYFKDELGVFVHFQWKNNEEYFKINAVTSEFFQCPPRMLQKRHHILVTVDEEDEVIVKVQENGKIPISKFLKLYRVDSINHNTAEWGETKKRKVRKMMLW